VLSIPRWVAASHRGRQALASLDPAVIHVREAVDVHLPAPAAVDPERARLALQRDAIQRAREQLSAAVVKLMVRGWDNPARLASVRALDVRMTQVRNATPPDFATLETLEQARRETVHEALESMAGRAQAGELLAAASTFPLRSHYQRQLADAQRACKQRHTVLKLRESDATARRDMEALDQRIRDLQSRRLP
jgi:hypothetical protein